MASAATPSSESAASPAGTPPWMRWAGIVFTVLPSLMLIMSAFMKLSHNADMVDKLVNHAGYPASVVPVLGILEVVSLLLYLIPQTAVLGVVLLTGYLGGAIATHVRVGDPMYMPLLVALLAWAGIYLRDARVRALLPLRR